MTLSLEKRIERLERKVTMLECLHEGECPSHSDLENIGKHFEEEYGTECFFSDDIDDATRVSILTR